MTVSSRLRSGPGRTGRRGYASFHWPSTVSPLVDAVLLEQWRATDPDRVYRAEVLAEWVDDAGAYFAADELDAAVRDYEFVAPGMRAANMEAVAGVDWGFARDASTLVLLAPLDEVIDRVDEAEGEGRDVLGAVVGGGVPGAVHAFHRPYCEVDRSYFLRRVTSEMNGVGAMPTQELAERLGDERVLGVHTDARLKEDAFGRLKLLLQQGRLRLPRHPGLLRQLTALEYEQRDSGMSVSWSPNGPVTTTWRWGSPLAVHGDPAIGAVRKRVTKLRFHDHTSGVSLGRFRYHE